MLRNFLGRIRSKPKKGGAEVGDDSGKKSKTPIGAMLQALFPNCPVCEKSIKGHFFAQIASTIVNDGQKSVLARLFNSVRQHEWDRLAEFNEWDALSDNVIVYVIRGDHADGIVLVVKDVFELYASNDLILLEPITDAGIASISNKRALDWQQV